MPSTENATLDGLQQIVDRLASRLGRSVAIDDAQGRLVVASGHFGEEDPMRVWAIVHRYSDPRVMAHFRAHGIYSWTAPGRIPQNRELQFKARVCCPIRDHDILFGHLFLIDEGVTEADVAQASAATRRIGALMYRRLALHEEASRHEEILVRRFVSPDTLTRRRAAHEAVDGLLLHAAEPAVSVVARVLPPVADAEALQTDLRAVTETVTRDRLRGVSLAWVRLDEVVLLLFGRATGEAGAVARRLVTELGDLGHRAVGGVGGVESGDAAAAVSFADAVLAARAGGALPELGSTVRAEDLGPYRLLLKLPPDELSAHRYSPALRRLVEADSADSLVQTLTTYLDHAGDAARTAAALHVHRSTLYYRLGRIQAVAGVDLHDGGQRLELHLGLRLHRLVRAMEQEQSDRPV